MNRSLSQPQENDDHSVAGRIAAALAGRIVTGALPPGMPVRQDHVAAEFRASHVPVREAFRKLEAQGLLVSEPRRGVRVAPLDPSTIEEVTEMRAALETLALRKAFARQNALDFGAASQALADGEASEDIFVWEEANRRFHRALVLQSAMPRLVAAIDDLHQASARFLFAAWKELDWRSRSDDEHRALLAHLERGDLDAAVKTLRQHILAAGRALAESLTRA